MHSEDKDDGGEIRRDANASSSRAIGTVPERLESMNTMMSASKHGFDDRVRGNDGSQLFTKLDSSNDWSSAEDIPQQQNEKE